MLNIQDKRSFRKDYKKLKSSGKDLSKLAVVIDTLAAGEPLAEHYRDHLLIGDYADHRECHILPNWLLIYQATETELILVRTGSHSALFGWYTFSRFYVGSTRWKGLVLQEDWKRGYFVIVKAKKDDIAGVQFSDSSPLATPPMSSFGWWSYQLDEKKSRVVLAAR